MRLCVWRLPLAFDGVQWWLNCQKADVAPGLGRSRLVGWLRVVAAAADDECCVPDEPSQATESRSGYSLRFEMMSHTQQVAIFVPPR